MKRLFVRGHGPLLLVVFACLFLFSRETLAAEAHFGWSPNTESNLAGYKIYCGTASRVYGPPVDVALGVQVSDVVLGKVTGLTAGQTYFCAATAYDTDGFQSDFSNEVTFVAIDQIYPATPAEVQLVIFRRNPDGTVDLYTANGEPLLDAAGNPIRNIRLP